MRHMMQKEILDAVAIPHLLTDSGQHVAAGAAAHVYVEDVCHPTKKIGTVTPRVITNTSTPTATKATFLDPMDVYQMSSNVSKVKAEEQENDSYQHEQDHECDGDEVFAGKGKGKGGFKV